MRRRLRLLAAVAGARLRRAGGDGELVADVIVAPEAERAGVARRASPRPRCARRIAGGAFPVDGARRGAVARVREDRGGDRVGGARRGRGPGRARDRRGAGRRRARARAPRARGLGASTPAISRRRWLALPARASPARRRSARCAGRSCRRAIDWLLVDVNLAPQVALHEVARLMPRLRATLRGAVFTLKLNDWTFVAELPVLVERIRAMGLAATSGCGTCRRTAARSAPSRCTGVRTCNRPLVRQLSTWTFSESVSRTNTVQLYVVTPSNTTASRSRRRGDRRCAHLRSSRSWARAMQPFADAPHSGRCSFRAGWRVSGVCDAREIAVTDHDREYRDTTTSRSPPWFAWREQGPPADLPAARDVARRHVHRSRAGCRPARRSTSRSASPRSARSCRSMRWCTGAPTTARACSSRACGRARSGRCGVTSRRRPAPTPSRSTRPSRSLTN